MIGSRVHLFAALMTGVAHVAVPPLQAQVRQDITIAAQPLEAALQQLMARSDLLVSYPSTLSAGRRSTAVSGETSAVRALSRMLEGTGLTYRQTGQNSFTLEEVPTSPGNSIQLGTVRVEGSSDRGMNGDVDGRSGAADAPYRTAGSVSHVRREQMDRVPPTSTGDIFLSTPGVVSAGNRNGQSLDLNIRGLQGMNRVATLIDGAAQQTSTYRGYGGTSSRTFIDPDMIGGIDISKGPSDSAYGAGAMGGVVNMRTLIAHDLVGEDSNFGVRVKAGIADNSREVPESGTRSQRFGRGGLTTDSRNLSIAAAYKDDRFELVGAFVERRNGNYTAGTKGNDRTTLTNRAGVVNEYPISLYGKNGEVFNTSRDTQSAMVKGTVRFGDGHAVELGYVRYDSVYGEEYPDANNPFSQWSWIEQSPLSDVLSNVYTAKYRWKPADNPLIDLRAEGWISDVDDFWGAMALRSKSVTKGVDIWNLSLVGTPLGALTLKYGGQYSVEESLARTEPTPPWGDNLYFEGTRKLGRVHANAELELTEWVKLSGGLSYEFFRTRGVNWREDTRLGLDEERLNPRASITLTPREGIQLFLSYAKGWRPATLRETLLDMDTLIRPNPLLRSEKSRSFEYGVNILQDGVFGGDRLKAKLVYFDSHYTDFIMREYGTSFGLPTNYRTYTNIDAVKFRGLEGSLDYQWRNLFVEAQANYYTDVQFCVPTGENGYLPCGRFTSGEDYQSEAVPAKYSGAVTLGGRFLSDRLTLGTRAVFAGKRAVGRRVAMSGSSVQSEWSPYLVFDLFGSFDIGEHLTFNASVENVGNRFYLDALSRARTPSPGRLVRLGLTGRFGGPDRTRTPAATQQQSLMEPFDGDWSGFYVGALSGYSEFDARNTVARGNGAPSAEGGRYDDGGLTFGGLFGHNWQMPGRLVLGVEADFGASTAKGGHSYLTTETPNLMQFRSTEAVYESANLWQGSVRARIGQGFGRLLLYGTAGIALRRDRLEREQFIATTAVLNPSRTIGSFKERDTKTHLGWVAGLGGELALSNRWSIRAEYMRSDFGGKAYAFDKARSGVLPDYINRQYVTDPVTGDMTLIETPVTRSASVIDKRRVKRDLVSQAIRLGIAYRF